MGTNYRMSIACEWVGGRRVGGGGGWVGGGGGWEMDMYVTAYQAERAYPSN